MDMSPVHQNHLVRHSERGKKTRQTEEKVGIQHQGMYRPGVRPVPVGSGEQGKMEETGCEIICGALATLTVQELMMIIMMMCKGANHKKALSPPLWASSLSSHSPV